MTNQTESGAATDLKALLARLREYPPRCYINSDSEATIRALEEHERLVSALEWLCAEKDALVTAEESDDVTASCCTEPAALLDMAKHLGWKPEASE